MAADLTLGDWMRRRRKALDLTQAGLARAVGCAVITVQKIEAGERRPSPQVAERIAACLGVAEEEHAAFVRFARGTPGSARAAAPAAFLRPRGTAVPAASRLPQPLTPLLGREQDILAVRRSLLRDDSRLVTLVGPPGVGTTRLGVAVTEDLRRKLAEVQ